VAAGVERKTRSQNANDVERAGTPAVAVQRLGRRRMGAKSCDNGFGSAFGAMNNSENKLGKMKPYPGVIAIVIDALKKKGMRFQKVSLKNGDISHNDKNVVVFRGDAAKVLHRAFHGEPCSVPAHQSTHHLGLVINRMGSPAWSIDGDVFHGSEIIIHKRSLPNIIIMPQSMHNAMHG